jgi:hypothetical protein
VYIPYIVVIALSIRVVAGASMPGIRIAGIQPHKEGAACRLLYPHRPVHGPRQWCVP